jgi:hypothetical protein
LREKIQHFNELLTTKKWIHSKESRIDKINGKLKRMNWQNEKDEIESIRLFYLDSIAAIKDFIAEEKIRLLISKRMFMK